MAERNLAVGHDPRLRTSFDDGFYPHSNGSGAGLMPLARLPKRRRGYSELPSKSCFPRVGSADSTHLMVDFAAAQSIDPSLSLEPHTEDPAELLIVYSNATSLAAKAASEGTPKPVTRS
jgi:hypothetical protein